MLVHTIKRKLCEFQSCYGEKEAWWLPSWVIKLKRMKEKDLPSIYVICHHALLTVSILLWWLLPPPQHHGCHTDCIKKDWMYEMNTFLCCWKMLLPCRQQPQMPWIKKKSLAHVNNSHKQWKQKGCHAWSCTVHTYQQLTCWFGKTLNRDKSICKRVGKNTIRCKRQPFWYILFENASCRKSAMNLHQFMFLTSFSFACTTQFWDKKLPHQHSNENIKKLSVTSFQITSK